MGMDLIARRNKKKGLWLHYNWNGWCTLWTCLNEWGVDTSEFSEWNDGKLIGAKTCLAVADSIRDHPDKLLKHGSEWIEGHEEVWRGFSKNGGCEQW